MLKIKEFIDTHDNWEELLSKEPYNLIVKTSKHYTLLKYNQLNANFNLEIVKEARGIIFNRVTKECVCHPFDKFGNYGEDYCPKINWSSASVQEKVDGSLIKFWYDDTWHISTNGTIDAFDATLGDNNETCNVKSYGDLVIKAIKETCNLHLVEFIYKYLTNKELCYMFELVSPLTKIVVPYSKTTLYYLGCRNNVTNEELSPQMYNPFKDILPTPKIYKLTTLNEVVKAASKLPWSEEGYVVCDEHFNRVKIKSPEYVKVHCLATFRGSITFSRLLDIIISNEQNEFLTYFPEYKDRVNTILTIRKSVFERILLDLNEIKQVFNPSTRKEFANIVMTKYPEYERPYLFLNEERLNKEFQTLTNSKLTQLIKGYINDTRHQSKVEKFEEIEWINQYL